MRIKITDETYEALRSSNHRTPGAGFSGGVREHDGWLIELDDETISRLRSKQLPTEKTLSETIFRLVKLGQEGLQ